MAPADAEGEDDAGQPAKVEACFVGVTPDLTTTLPRFPFHRVSHDRSGSAIL